MLLLLACAEPSQEALVDVPCVDGQAGPYPCQGVDLAAYMPLDALLGTGLNDVWGWADADSGRELVLAGMLEGTAVVDATEPTAPVLLGVLPSATGTNTWRDIQVVGDHAYIVAEERGHGIQVLDLKSTLDGDGGLFEAVSVFEESGRAHNIVALPERDLVWAVGGDHCEYGMYAVDVSDPTDLREAGCWSGGFVHDAHCVVYDGPDTEHVDKTICVAFTPEIDDFVTVIDFTDPSAPVTLSGTTFPNAPYSHQGWFTEDHAFVLVNDEYDEEEGANTRTIVMDARDLDDLTLIGDHEADTAARTHDEYVRGDKVYQANYEAGLQILDIVDASQASLEAAGHFDTYPDGNENSFEGAWGVYPFLPSGTVAISSVKEGLFLVRPHEL